MTFASHGSETLSNCVAFVKRAIEYHVAASACPGDLAAEGASLEGFRVKLVNMRRGNARSHFFLLQPAFVEHFTETIEVSRSSAFFISIAISFTLSIAASGSASSFFVLSIWLLMIGWDSRLPVEQRSRLYSSSLMTRIH